MPEGLSPVEVGKEGAEETATREDGKARVITIVEAVLLAVVAVLAAWSGHASAKWATESSPQLAKASAARTMSNRVDLDAQTVRNFDSSTFDAWFTGYLRHSPSGETLAINRFRPPFKVAFDAWLATDPATNPHAPKGPTYMPRCRQPAST